MAENSKRPFREDGRSMKAGNTLPQSFGYAFEGIRTAFSERNFKVHCLVAVMALILCAVLSVPAWGWIAVIICIGMVFAAEALNTAVEAVVDLASPELHSLAKRAKDCAAGAVLILAIVSLLVAAIVYIPPFLALAGILQ